MKKFIKVVFGQTMIIAMLLVLQVLFFFSTTFRIMSDQHFRYLNLAIRIASVIIMVYIVNGKGNPESKLVWIVQLAILPIMGTLFYLFVQGQKVPMLVNKELKRLRRDKASYIEQQPEVVREIEELDTQKSNFIRYMNKYADTPVFTNTDVTYYPTGESCWTAIMEELERAEKYIFIEYFIIDEGEMWDSILGVLRRKAAQGVEIRVMYDGMGCLTRLRHDYPKKLAAMGIKCRVFNPFRPFLSTIQNNRDHRKILVIDGKTAFTGGVNLSDEYVNITHPYGYWKDTAVRLKGEAAFSFAVMFLELWQISSKQREDDYDKYRPEDGGVKCGGYVMPFGDSPFDGELVGETVYMDILSKARKYVHITTPYLIIDHEMITTLGSAAKSGVDVKIIVPHKADHWYAHAVAKAYYAELIGRGVELYEYMPGFIHSKSFVSDGDTAVVGSINMDYRSLYLHFECAAWMYKSDAVGDIEKDFQECLGKCRPITLESCKVRGIKKVVYAILRLFAPLM